MTQQSRETMGHRGLVFNANSAPRVAQLLDAGIMWFRAGQMGTKVPSPAHERSKNNLRDHAYALAQGQRRYARIRSSSGNAWLRPAAEADQVENAK